MGFGSWSSETPSDAVMSQGLTVLISGDQNNACNQALMSHHCLVSLLSQTNIKI